MVCGLVAHSSTGYRSCPSGTWYHLNHIDYIDVSVWFFLTGQVCFLMVSKSNRHNHAIVQAPLKKKVLRSQGLSKCTIVAHWLLWKYGIRFWQWYTWHCNCTSEEVAALPEWGHTQSPTSPALELFDLQPDESDVERNKALFCRITCQRNQTFGWCPCRKGAGDASGRRD